MNCIFLRRGYGTSGDGINYVEYIKTSGTQYFDTGYYPNQNTCVEMDIQLTDNSSTAWFFGGRTAANNSALGLYAYANNGKIYFVYGANQTTFSSNISGLERHTYIVNKNEATVDGETVSITAQTFTSSATLCLLARNTGGTIASYASAILYPTKISENGILLHDYRPAIDPNGVVCLYDKVEQAYLYMSGTGTLEAGPSIGGGGSSDTCTVTITDEGYDYYEVTVNGTTYSSPAVITINEGDVISVFAMTIYMDGVQVGDEETYTFVVNGNINIHVGAGKYPDMYITTT